MKAVKEDKTTKLNEKIKTARVNYWGNRRKPPPEPSRSETRIVAVDPQTLEIIVVFYSIAEFEYATNLKRTRERLWRYEKNILPKKGTSTMNGWFLAIFLKREWEGMSEEQFNEAVQKKILHKRLLYQAQRLKDNVNSFSIDEKEKIVNFLDSCLTINPKDMKHNIKL
jgi:hypothetical protein